MANPAIAHGFAYPLEPDELEALRRAMRDRLTEIRAHDGVLAEAAWLTATFGPRMVNAGYRWLTAGVANG